MGLCTIFKMACFDYYATEARKDYYRDGSIGAAEWFGRGAKVWGYVNDVVAFAYQCMQQGFTADGRTKLTQNAGRADRYSGHDITFEADKYVSIAWGLDRDATARRNIEQYAVVGAAKDALQFAEDTLLFTRRGKAGATVEQGVGMLSCLWLHGRNRRDEMHLHVHACTGNMVLRQDGTSGTILGIAASKEDARNKRGRESRSALHAFRDELGRVFSESLRSRMEHLGYRTADVVGSKHGFWTIVGISEQLVQDFSTRALDIKQDMERRGVSGGKEASRSALRTRDAKTASSLDDLFVSWRERANGFDPATIRVHQAAIPSLSPAVSKEWRERVEAEAQLHVVGRAPRERTASATNGVANQHSAHLASTQVGRADRRAGDGKEERQAAASHDDKKTLRAAAAVARILRSSRRNRSHALTRTNIFVAAKQVEYLARTTFTAQEREALVDITRKRGAIQFLGAGPSGPRIEPVLKAARIAWERQGYRVLLATGSRAEAEQFEKRTGIHSITTTGLIRGLSTNRGLLRGYDAAMKKSLSLGPRLSPDRKHTRPGRSKERRVVVGFSSGSSFVNYALKAAGRWLQLDSKTVLVVESARLGLTERADLLKRVQKSGAKIVFIGTQEVAESSEQLLRPRRESAREEFQLGREREREREHERRH